MEAGSALDRTPLRGFKDFYQYAGTTRVISGRNLLEWPVGRFNAQLHGKGHAVVRPADGVALQGADIKAGVLSTDFLAEGSTINLSKANCRGEFGVTCSAGSEPQGRIALREVLVRPGGHFYLGGGTPCQQAGGYDDTPAEMAKYLAAASPECDPEKIRLYSEGSVEHFGWLESLGFEFERSYFPGKAVIQPGTEGLMFTGNEKVWPYRDEAVPAPRGHKVPVPGDTEGARMVMDLLRGRVDEAGFVIVDATGRTSTPGVWAAGNVVDPRYS
mgnify:CR=1 FL=1